MTIYLDDILDRHPNTRPIDYPIPALTVVACRARIAIGSQGWVKRAARVVEIQLRQEAA